MIPISTTNANGYKVCERYCSPPLPRHRFQMHRDNKMLLHLPLKSDHPSCKTTFYCWKGGHITEGQLYNSLFFYFPERYRLQCDKFEAMWLIAKELSSRLNNHYNKGKPGSFAVYYSGTVPLQEYFDLIDCHFEVSWVTLALYRYKSTLI